MFSVKLLAFAATAAAAAIATPLQARQFSSSTQFGVASLDPTSLANGTTFHFTYDSTLAEVQGYRVDLYMQGTDASGEKTPLITIFSGGNNLGTEPGTFKSTETTPDLVTLGYGDIESWTLVAQVTHHSNVTVPLSGNQIQVVDIVGSTFAPFTFNA